MTADVPALPVELARLKLSMLAKEAWYYDVSFMHATIGSWPIEVLRVTSQARDMPEVGHVGRQVK